MQFTQNAIRPGFYRIGGTMREVTRDNIAAYCTGTRKALKAGLSIPILDAHDFSGDLSCGPTANKNATSGLGWVTGVIHHKDGSMSHKLDVTDPDAAQKIKNGSIRHTSPQFLEDYTDGDGEHYGPIVRHVALTPTPRTKHQGPIVADSQPLNALSFSEDDYLGSTIQEAQAAMTSFAEDDPKKKFPPEGEEAGDVATDEPADTTKGGGDEPGPEAAEVPEIEPITETPVDSSDEAKITALISELQGIMGVVVADGASMPEILTAIVNMQKARAIDKAEVAAENQVTEEPAIQSFSEEQQAYVGGLEARLRAQEAVTAKAVLANDRARLRGKLRALGLPPAAHNRFDTMIQTTSFAEGEEAGTLGILQAGEIFKSCLPPGMSFAEDDVITEEHERSPDGGDFLNKAGEAMTDAEHLEAAKAQAARAGFGNHKPELQTA